MTYITSCSLCDRISQLQDGSKPTLIYEFRHSLWVVGDHQFFPGYTLLILKEHVRELIDLEYEASLGYYEELMIASGAVRRALNPWKLNYSNYGNRDPHLHWHIFPRREKEPERTLTPFQFSAQFDAHATSPETAQALAEQLRKGLAG